MKTILVTGGTGFIGKALIKHLCNNAYKIIVLSRNKQLQQQSNNEVTYIHDLAQISPQQKINIIINLAGEPLNAKRWSEQQKQVIIDSRVSTTLNLLQWLETSKRKIDLLVSGSAIGWYGHWQDQPLTEESNANPGFSHDLCQQWESTARKFSAVCENIVLLRIGIVLENDGGPLAAMLPPFKAGLGGKMGSGEQYWSWIHRKDLIKLIQLIIEQHYSAEPSTPITGVINATAPGALPQAEFAQVLSKVLKRPCILPMPAFVASLMMGEFANEVLLNGQNVIPEKAQSNGFVFDFPDLEGALQDILVY